MVWGPGTTAYVPFGEVRERPLASRAETVPPNPSTDRCAGGFRIAANLCCRKTSKTLRSVPAGAIDLSRFKAPLRVEILEAKVADSP